METEQDGSISPRDSGMEQDASMSPRDSGMETVQDAGMDAGDMVLPQGPILEFVHPEPATSPDDETVWVEPTITVRCKATPSSETARVNASSVKISMEKTGPESTERVQGAVDAEGDEFEAEFSVGDMPNGELKFHCEARDLAAVPATSSTTFTTLLDLGPTIELTEPKEAQYALRNPVPIEFKVSPVSVADGDTKAAAAEVKLVVSGVPIPVTEDVAEPGVYRATVDFDDRTLYPVVPSSAEVRVTASSSRTPVAPVRSVKRDIVIDGSGPTITVQAPANGSIVHGTKQFVVVVTDPSGVAEDSVKAEFKAVVAPVSGSGPKGDHVITEWNVTGSTYAQSFNTGTFDPTVNQVTIQVSARDIVDNTTTVFHSLILDNVPPILSLDPPMIREWREVNDVLYCSEEFDPVGDDAMNDLGIASTYAQFRLLIEDQANTRPGQTALYIAGVKTDDVYLFVQGDTTQPFLIDTNADGFCDEIKTDLGVASPTRLKLSPLTSRGAAWFPKAFSMTPTVPVAAWCNPDPNGRENEPDPFCSQTDMFRAVPGRSEDRPPAVYGFDPTNTNLGECQGKRWSVGDIVHEGWACFAARATDRNGKIGVSPAIRVCFDDGEGAPDPCVADIVALNDPEVPDPELPDCMEECEMDEVWQVYQPGMVWKVQ